MTEDSAALDGASIVSCDPSAIRVPSDFGHVSEDHVMLPERVPPVFDPPDEDPPDEDPPDELLLPPPPPPGRRLSDCSSESANVSFISRESAFPQAVIKERKPIVIANPVANFMRRSFAEVNGRALDARGVGALHEIQRPLK